mmetsp:Transcript_122175/g.304953  ORF Transcript_122175/g.304953 Transcript_122175/m.304953 type:complete len:455 (-) Transcript_122175:347-1711(-)
MVGSMVGNYSWVEPYLESPWVKVMGIFAPSFPAPDAAADVSGEAFHHFIAACAGGAAILAVTSVLAAVGVLLRSCCCSGRRLQLEAPSVKPLICMAFMTFTLTFAGMFVYLLVGHKGVSLTMDAVTHAVSDVTSAAEQGRMLSALGAGASVALNSSIPKCQGSARPFLQQFQRQLESYIECVDQYNSDMEGIPEQLRDLQTSLGEMSDREMYSLLAPLVLVLLCCLAIVLAVCATRSTRGSGRCSNCCIRSLGPLLFAPAILIVGAATSVEFGFSLASASFCKDVDTNALTYIQHFAGNTTYDISRYYISGVGTNPLLDQLHEANETALKLEKTVEKYGSTVATVCADAGPTVKNISETLEAAHAPLNQVDFLLSPANVYPLYKEAIHDDACSTIISGFAWLVIIQYVVGIVCLPTLTCMAEKFMDRWVAYQADRRNPAALGLMPSRIEASRWR